MAEELQTKRVVRRRRAVSTALYRMTGTDTPEKYSSLTRIWTRWKLQGVKIVRMQNRRLQTETHDLEVRRGSDADASMLLLINYDLGRAGSSRGVEQIKD